MANLIECGGCRAPVSSEAAACPRCGHPIQPPVYAQPPAAKSSLGTKITLVVITLVVIGAVVGSQKKEKDRKEVAAPSADTKIIDVTAEQLRLDYAANEVRADEKYKGQVLRISGVVQGIKKDFSDDTYVELETGNRFESAHAEFVDGATAGRLNIGQHIVVRCRGNNVILTSPMLKDCVLE